MFNLTLFKRSLKSNWLIMLIFAGILTMYFTIIVNMYDPESLDVVKALSEMKMPPELLSAMGFTITDPSLIGFISSFFYGMLMLAFPMIYYIIVCNKLVASYVDKGSMASILATPSTRVKIASTQAVFSILSTFLVIGFIHLFGIVFCELRFPGLLDISGFLRLFLGTCLLHFAVSGICFFSSCFFNESRYSLALGAGLPIIFLLINMISNAGSELENFKYATIFSLFNAGNVAAGENCLVQLISLALIGIVLYVGGIVVFNKKDIPV